MSELGNIQKSYGKQFNIAVANTNGSVIENQTSLPANTLIITAPMLDGKDVGTHTLFITDYAGTPVRLTYNIQLGNGLYADTNNTDSVKLQLGDNTITTVDSNLSVAIENIIDVSTLIDENGKIALNADALDLATDTTAGVIKIDGFTIKKYNSGDIYVDTDNLDKANESQYGIVISDNDTISISDDGIISVNTIPTATDTQYGVIQVDGKTITSTDGLLSIDTTQLSKSSSDTFGTIQPDNTTVKLSDDTLYVNTQNITHASETTSGVIKIDDTLSASNGTVSVCEYDTLVQKLNIMLSKISAVEETINSLNKTLGNL